MEQIDNKTMAAPNFTLLKKYYNELNEDRYFNYLKYYSGKVVFNDALEVIKKQKLSAYKNEIMFFFVEYGISLQQTIIMRNENFAKLHNEYRKQSKALYTYLTKLLNSEKSYGLTTKERDKAPVIKSIKFESDKATHHLKIDSHMLCDQIVRLLEDKIKNNNTKLVSNLNPNQYELSFVLSLTSFFNYLKKEVPSLKTDGKIYEFIAIILETLNEDINISSKRIKDTLIRHKKQKAC